MRWRRPDNAVAERFTEWECNRVSGEAQDRKVSSMDPQSLAAAAYYQGLIDIASALAQPAADGGASSYGDAYGGYSDAAGGYSDAAGGYADAYGGYSDPAGGYSDAYGGYADAYGGYSDPAGGYFDADGGYTDAMGNYADPATVAAYAQALSATLSGSPY